MKTKKQNLLKNNLSNEKNKIKNLLFILFFVGLFLAWPQITFCAQESIKFIPQVIGDIGFGTNKTEMVIDGNSIKTLIIKVYKYFIGIVGLLSTVVIMIGGLIWLTAGDNTNKISEAQDYLKGAITGLILALCSFLILATINPKLTEIKTIILPQIQSIPSKSENKSITEKSETEIKDVEIRKYLSSNGIYINKESCVSLTETNCTTVAYLPQKAIDGLVEIRKAIGVNIVITGGTEETGHRSHGPGKSIVDLRIQDSAARERYNTELLKYFNKQFGLSDNKNLEIGKFYENNKYKVLREKNNDGSEHLHIEFK